MKPSLAEIGNILGGDSKAADRHMYGQIQSVITDASGKVTGYEVSLGGGSDTLRCRKIVGASVGDTVMVTRMANGIAVVTGTVGGDADALKTLEETEDLQDMIGDGSTTGIKVATEYCLHTSNQTAPGSGAVWSEDLPAYIAGRYYWKRTKTTYADNSAVYSTPILDGLSQLSAEADYLLDSVNNHFWFDNTGAYVSENDKSYATGYATRIASSGIAQMYNGVVLNTLTGSGITYYAYDANASGSRVQLASYAASGIGFNDKIPFKIGNNASYLRWYDSDNNGTADSLEIIADSLYIGNSAVATASDVSAAVSGKSDKSSTVTQAVSVFYRSTTNSTPSISTSTNIGTSAETDNAWEYVMPQPKRGRYFFTCEKYTHADGSVGFSTVRALASETYASMWVSSSNALYIDGGRIYANTITASQIAANTITANELAASSINVGDFYDDGTYASPGDNLSTFTNDSGFITEANADKYVTYIDSTNGVRVYSAAGQPNTYAQMNSNGFSVVQSGTTMASFGTTTRIGSTSAANMLLGSSAFSLRSGTTKIIEESYETHPTEGKYAHLRTFSGRKFGINNEESGFILTAMNSSNHGQLIPFGDNYMILGNTSYRWKHIYAIDTTITSSDHKDKEITGTIDFAEDLILALRPIDFYRKESDQRRKRMGFIAQEVAKACEDLGQNLNLYTASYKDDHAEYHGEEADDKLLTWGMSYEELIAPMVKVIQKQHADIKSLELRVSAIEAA